MKTKLLLLTLFSIFVSRVHSQWPAIPSPNVAVTSLGGVIDAAKYWACRDGIGGSYVVWEDDRNDLGNNTGIFCQRMQNFGVVKFAVNGITVSDVAGSTQKRPRISEGTNSSALIVWEDERNIGTTLDDIYAKAIDSVGNIIWGGVNGVVICNAADKQERPQIVTDGAGGGIIVWRDKRNNGASGIDIYAQRINSAGVVQWTANGVVISSAANDQTSFHVIADGSGGAIITWEDNRNATVDVYAQKINFAGVVQWTANGVAICTNTVDAQLSPQAVTDGAGGAIITWEDLRIGGIEDIYAQRVSSVGVVQWAVDGIIICNATDPQARPIITTDGAGGGVITWEDDRSATSGTGTGRDIYAQRVNGAGTVQWAVNGVAVCVAIGRQKRAHSSTANNNSILVAWQDARTGTEDIFVEVISPTGTMNSGTLNGVIICNNVSVQKRPFIFDNASNEWIAVWEDERINPGASQDIYSQGLNPTILIALPIELLAFNVIPNGDVVEIDWVTNSEINNDFFIIQRSQNGIDWEDVITTSGAGTSNSMVEYFEIDTKPLNGLSYYQLIQTDFDGKTSISNIIPVEYLLTQNGGSVSVYPNPARDNDNVNINFSGFEGSEVLVVLRDMRGKEVYSKVSLIQNENQIIAIDNTHQLSPGIYLVLASSKNVLYSKKLIITE